MNGEGRVITQVGYGTVGGGAAADPRAQAPGPSKGVLQWLRDWWGGWAGPKASVHSPAAYELERERLRGGPPHLVIPQFLPYFDDSSGETATMRLAYRKMMADPNVKSALLGKILAVAALDLQVQPADKKNGYDKHVADFVTWNFTRRLRGAIPELVWAVLSGGLIDGYAVVEKVIVPEHRGKWSGKFVLSQLKPKDTYYDLVLQADEYRNVVGVMGLRYNAGEVFHPANFVVYRHLPLYGQPTGASDLRAVYSRYWLLDTALKLRAIGLEKRAMPVMHGTYPAANPTVKGSLETALASLSSKNWLATPAEAQVQALNIAGTSDDIFAGAIRDLKHDIFLGIQGAILQALEGTITDGRGASSVHSSTADLLKWHLSAVISALLNDPESGLIRDIVDLNFVVSEYPWASLSAIDLSVLLQELQIDNGLRQMGLPLSKDEIYERYGRKPPETPDDEMAPAGPDAGPPGGPGHPGGAIGTAGAPPMPKLPDPSKGPGSDRRGDSVGAGGAKLRGSPFAEFADDWDEDKHPRGDDGRFGKGSGGGADGESKGKPTAEDAAASLEEVSGRRADNFNKRIDALHKQVQGGELSAEEADAAASELADQFTAAAHDAVRRRWPALRDAFLAKHGDGDVARRVLVSGKVRLWEILAEIEDTVRGRAAHPADDAPREDRDAGRSEVKAAGKRLADAFRSAERFMADQFTPAINRKQLVSALTLASDLNARGGKDLTDADRKAVQKVQADHLFWRVDQDPATGQWYAYNAADRDGKGEVLLGTPEGGQRHYLAGHTPHAEGDWDESKVKRADDGRFGSKPGQRSRNERQKAKRAKRQARRQERPDAPRRDEAPARPSPEAREQVKASLLDKLLTVAPAKAKEWAGKLKQKAWESLTPAEQKLCGAVAAVEHAMASGPSELAAEAARQRGLSDEQAEAVRKAARGADLAFAWTLNVPVAHDVLHHAGVGHAVGEAGAAIAAKVGYYLPVGSLSYLAYSTARNPLATIRAAKAVIEKALATRHAEGDWEEGKHPRDDSGQFTSGGASSGGPKPSQRETDYQAKVTNWKSAVAAVEARNKAAREAWESRASARADRQHAAEELNEARLLADEMPLVQADPEQDEDDDADQ